MQVRNKPMNVVVDADVARSAGTSEYPVSKHSRELLQALIQSEHKVAFCPALTSEWRRHASKFSIMWLAAMTARKKIIRSNQTETITPEIIRLCATEKATNIALKDIHLIDLALAESNFLASNDVVARKVFLAVAAHHTPLKQIMWVVPVNDGETVVEFLKNGGYPSDNWFLR